MQFRAGRQTDRQLKLDWTRRLRYLHLYAISVMSWTWRVLTSKSIKAPVNWQARTLSKAIGKRVSHSLQVVTIIAIIVRAINPRATIMCTIEHKVVCHHMWCHLAYERIWNRVSESSLLSWIVVEQERVRQCECVCELNYDKERERDTCLKLNSLWTVRLNQRFVVVVSAPVIDFAGSRALQVRAYK